LDFDPGVIDLRIKQRVSPAEFFGLLFSCALVGVFIWLISINQGYPRDFGIYLEGKENPYFYYGYWLLPILELLKRLPLEVSYGIWCLVNILGVLFAVRVFNGKAVLVLASYQLLSSLYYGQISGIIAGGLALCWWGMMHRRWYIAGLGFLLAVTKFQIGLPMGLLLMWYAGIRWRDFLRLLVVPAVIGIFSVILYPIWPIDVLEKIMAFPFVHLGITFWNYMDAWSLLFWIPALLLPLSRSNRFLALVSLCAFAVPYYLHFDLITLFSFPIGWLPLGGYLGLLFPLYGMLPVRAIVVVPFVCYLIAILPEGYQFLRKKWMRVSARST